MIKRLVIIKSHRSNNYAVFIRTDLVSENNIIRAWGIWGDTISDCVNTFIKKWSLSKKTEIDFKHFTLWNNRDTIEILGIIEVDYIPDTKEFIFTNKWNINLQSI